MEIRASEFKEAQETTESGDKEGQKYQKVVSSNNDRGYRSLSTFVRAPLLRNDAGPGCVVDIDDKRSAPAAYVFGTVTQGTNWASPNFSLAYSGRMRRWEP